MGRPQSNFKRHLEKATQEALRRTSLWLDARFTEEISSVKWKYPTPPEIRDIVDTGRLRASQTRVTNSDGSVTFTWPTEYATQVHEGGVSISGMRFPGRPWTDAPLEEVHIKMSKNLKETLEAIR